MKIVITGGAGFIGSNLVKKLIYEGHEITVIDNFSTGSIRNLHDLKNVKIVNADLKDVDLYKLDLVGADILYHLAANADVRDGFLHPQKDIEENILVTSILMEEIVKAKISNIIFSSTAACLGEPSTFPTPENIDFPKQTSLYGMSKAACEGILSAYAEKYNLNVAVFRFVSVVGPNYSHGHIYDFVKKLKQNSRKLQILGDGNQRKSYLHIDDVISGLLLVSEDLLTWRKGTYQVYHIGNNNYCTVNQSATWISEAMGLSPVFKYTGGLRGWVGDSPFVFLSTKKLEKMGWLPAINLERAIKLTTKWLLSNDWIFDERK